LTFNGPLFKGDKEESKTSFIVSARRSYLQFLFQLVGLPIRPDYWDYQFKVTHKFDDYNTLDLLGLGSIDNFSLDPPAEKDASTQALLDQAPFIDQRTNAIGLSWKSRYKNRSGFMETVLSNNYLINDFKRYTDNETLDDIFFRNNAKEAETKLRHSQKYFFNEWVLNFGGNVQRSAYRNKTFNTVYDFSFDTQIDFFKYGFFANVNKDVLKTKLNVNLGFRLDDDTFIEGNDLLSTFSPRVSLSYRLADRWKLNATAGRYFKLPPYTVLGFLDNGVLVNKDAKYIQSDHLVFGVERVFGPASSLSVEGFYKWYSDYPVSLIDSVSLANKGAGFEVLGNEDIVSVGKGRTYGIEVLLQQKLSKKIYGIVSYTYFISQFTGLDASVYLPSLWDSRHLASFTGGYKMKRNWEVSSRMRYAGRTPYVPTDLRQTALTYPNVVLDYDRLGDLKLSAFAQLDFRIDKKWNLKNMSIDLFFDIQNVLGRSNPQAPEYLLARDGSGAVIEPRSLLALDPSEGSAIPSIGFVLDF